jgi:hypothetical protein
MAFWFVLAISIGVGLIGAWLVCRRVPWIGMQAEIWLGTALGGGIAASIAACGLGATHPRSGDWIPGSELAGGVALLSLLMAIIGFCFLLNNWRRKSA